MAAKNSKQDTEITIFLNYVKQEEKEVLKDKHEEFSEDQEGAERFNVPQTIVNKDWEAVVTPE